MAIEEVVDWATTTQGNKAHHPTSREGERAIRISRSMQELQAAIARWRDQLATGTNVSWGNIIGTLSDQTDLQAALNAKLSLTGGNITGSLSVGGVAVATVNDIASPAGTNRQIQWNDNGAFGASGDLTFSANPTGTWFETYSNTITTGTLASFRVDNNPASGRVIRARNSGTGAVDILEMLNSGTGNYIVANNGVNDLFVLDSSGYITNYANLTPGNGEALAWSVANSRYEPTAIGGTPGGIDTTVQFNDGGAFNGIGGIRINDPNLQIYDGSRLVIGTGTDLQIYHSSNQNYIVGNDVLNIGAASRVDIVVDAGNIEIGSGSLIPVTSYALGSSTNGFSLLSMEDRATSPFNNALWRRTSDGALIWTNNVGTEFDLTAGGGIGGSIADNQIAVGATTADEIEGASTGNARLTWDGTDLVLGDDNITGIYKGGAGLGRLRIASGTSEESGANIQLNGPSVAGAAYNFAIKSDGVAVIDWDHALGRLQLFGSNSLITKNLAITVNSDGTTTFAGTAITRAADSFNAAMIMTQGSAPSTPTDGMVWSTSSGMFIRAGGNTIGPFIDSNPASFTVPPLGSDPGTPGEGDLWQNTTSDDVKVQLNGTTEILATQSWVTANAGGIGGSIGTDQVAFGTAGGEIEGSADLTFNDTDLQIGAAGAHGLSISAGGLRADYVSASAAEIVTTATNLRFNSGSTLTFQGSGINALTFDASRNATFSEQIDWSGGRTQLGTNSFGIFELDGATTGSSQGGQLRLFTGDDFDTTINFYGFGAFGDDLRIFDSAGGWTHWFRDSGTVELAGALTVQSGDITMTTGGIVFNDDNTGLLNNYTAGTALMTFDFSQTAVNSSSFRYGRNTNTTGPLSSEWFAGDGTTNRVMLFDHKVGEFRFAEQGSGARFRLYDGAGVPFFDIEPAANQWRMAKEQYVIGVVEATIPAVTQTNWVNVGELQHGSYVIRISTDGFALYNAWTLEVTGGFAGAADGNGSHPAFNCQAWYQSEGGSELQAVAFEFVSTDSANLWLQIGGTASGVGNYTIAVEGVSTDISGAASAFIADGTVTQTDPTLTDSVPEIYSIAQGSTFLSYQGSAKFTVQSDGADMSGNLDFRDNDRIRMGNSNDLLIYHDGSNSYLSFHPTFGQVFHNAGQYQWQINSVSELILSSGALYPFANLGLDSGSIANQWANVYTQNVVASGDVTANAGTVSGDTVAVATDPVNPAQITSTSSSWNFSTNGSPIGNTTINFQMQTTDAGSFQGSASTFTMRNPAGQNIISGSTGATTIANPLTLSTPKLLIPAANTVLASLNIASGSSAPSARTNGDMWYDGTSLFFRSGGADSDLLANSGLSGTVANDQIVVGTGANTVDSSAALTWNGNTMVVGSSSTSNTTLTVAAITNNSPAVVLAAGGVNGFSLEYFSASDTTDLQVLDADGTGRLRADDTGGTLHTCLAWGNGSAAEPDVRGYYDEIEVFRTRGIQISTAGLAIGPDTTNASGYIVTQRATDGTLYLQAENVAGSGPSIIISGGNVPTVNRRDTIILNPENTQIKHRYATTDYPAPTVVYHSTTNATITSTTPANFYTWTMTQNHKYRFTAWLQFGGVSSIDVDIGFIAATGGATFTGTGTYNSVGSSYVSERINFDAGRHSTVQGGGSTNRYRIDLGATASHYIMVTGIIDCSATGTFAIQMDLSAAGGVSTTDAMVLVERIA